METKLRVFILVVVMATLDVMATLPNRTLQNPRYIQKRVTSQSNTFFQPNSTSSLIKGLLRFYDKNDPPSKSSPTVVHLGIYVNSFHSISEQTMDYSVSMYLRQSWRDPRLAFPASVPKHWNNVRLGDNSWNDVWLPDTFFRNEKRATFHDVTVNNRLLRLNKTGHLWYVTKISATLSCPMMLSRYPMDTQKCPMMFESFGYNMDTMYFAWLPNPVDFDEFQLPQYNLITTIQHDCSQNYTAGSFSCLELRFVLKRNIGYFLIQIYIPSTLIVILSWVSFWINVDASPARVSIGLLTVLTTTTQSAGANSSLPRVSYVKAIDVWMSACLVFVFLGLLEYALVNVLARRREVSILHSIPRPQFGMKPAPQPTQPNPESQLDQIAPVENHDKRCPPKVVDPEGKQRARRVDKVSRLIFPVAFLVFNLAYWFFYISKDMRDDYQSED